MFNVFRVNYYKTIDEEENEGLYMICVVPVLSFAIKNK